MFARNLQPTNGANCRTDVPQNAADSAAPPEVGGPEAEILQTLPETRKDGLSLETEPLMGPAGAPSIPTGRGVRGGISRFHPIRASVQASNDFATTKGRLA